MKNRPNNCAKCNGKAVLMQTFDNVCGTTPLYYVRCANTLCDRRTCPTDTPEKAVADWNRRVKVICPKCGNCMTYKNYWSWVLHTPFHWFGKRKTKCTKCGEVSYIGREKGKVN